MRTPRPFKMLMAALLVTAATAILHNPAHAGRSCVEFKPDAVTVQ